MTGGGRLQLTAAQMRTAGYAAVDALVTRLADAASDPVLRRATPAELAERFGGPAPESPSDLVDVLDQVLREVLRETSRTDHPGYFAYIPSFTTWPAALAELLAAATNPYCGSWMESAGPTQVEVEVLGWFRDWLGLPPSTAGVFVTGGSAANLTALMVARDTSAVPPERAVLYVSDQGHSSLARTARTLGYGRHQVRVIPSDSAYRLDPAALAGAVAADIQSGRVPHIVCANAGSTNTGSVDPLPTLADLCAEHAMWLHVDGAYGAFAALTERGREALVGIERADSVTLDPHKWLFQPMECGSVLVRDGRLLQQAFAVHPDYLEDARGGRDGEVDFADRGLQLSRSFRALKVWMSVRTFGLSAFRDAVDAGLDLAAYAETLVRADPRLELLAPATLGIICFRRVWPDADEEETARRNTLLAAALMDSGRAMVSSTRLSGRHAARLCALNPASRPEDVEAVVTHFAAGVLEDAVPLDALAPDARAPRAPSLVDQLAPAPGDESGDAPVRDVLAGLPLFAGAPDSVLDVVAADGAVLDVPAGTAVVRRWDTDGTFYLVLAGRLEVSIDARHVRWLTGGDFFGELAARDWGAGYGYARLATVTVAEPSRLFALPAALFGALVEHEPEVRARINAAIRERLPIR